MTKDEVMDVLHMNGGTGDTSYAVNSFFQRKALLLTKPVAEEVMRKLWRSKFPVGMSTSSTLAIADLGCSSGPNTLFAVSELIKVVENLCKEEGRELPEIQVFLNDLPGNDFNTVFRLKEQQHYSEKLVFINGVPGSFYGRLFPAKSIHLVHSSCSVQWLSQIPPGLEEINKGNINISSSDNTPNSVEEAYKQQFQSDFSFFLRCRAQELVNGGCMVLTICGRRSEHPCAKEGCYYWDLLSLVLNQMASEGIINKEKLDRFNIPEYMVSAMEVEGVVREEGSFLIHHLGVSEVSWDSHDNDVEEESMSNAGPDNVAKCVRAVAEPLLVNHFECGDLVIEEVFRRYKDIIVSEHKANDKKTGSFVFVIVSLINNTN
ncbi:Salicylate carboxymethyltransferase [Linum perenne]